MRAKFDYLRPSSPQEAVQMKAEHKNRAMFWAGGTDIALRWMGGLTELDYCIDLTHIDALDDDERRAGDQIKGFKQTIDGSL